MTNEEQTAREVFRHVFGREAEVTPRADNGPVHRAALMNSRELLMVQATDASEFTLPEISVTAKFSAPTLSEAAQLATRGTFSRARVVEAMRDASRLGSEDHWRGALGYVAGLLNIPWSEVEP